MLTLCTGRLKCDGTWAETRFRLSAKRTSPFKSTGGRQFSRLLAAHICASAVVMLDTPCSEVVWRVLATHPIRQFPLHFPSCALLCAITFQLDSTYSSDIKKFCPTQFISITYVSYQLTEQSMAETRGLNSEILWYHSNYQEWYSG